MGQTGRSTSGWVSLQYDVLMFKLPRVKPWALNPLKNYFCIIRYCLSLYHKCCPIMPFWILLPSIFLYKSKYIYFLCKHIYIYLYVYIYVNISINRYFSWKIKNAIVCIQSKMYACVIYFWNKSIMTLRICQFSPFCSQNHIVSSFVHYIFQLNKFQ